MQDHVQESWRCGPVFLPTASGRVPGGKGPPSAPDQPSQPGTAGPLPGPLSSSHLILLQRQREEEQEGAYCKV